MIELKVLKDLLKTLRANGVTRFESGEVKLELSELEPQRPSSPQHPAEEPDPWESLSPAERLAWSALPTGPDLSKDPE